MISFFYLIIAGAKQRSEERERVERGRELREIIDRERERVSPLFLLPELYQILFCFSRLQNTKPKEHAHQMPKRKEKKKNHGGRGILEVTRRRRKREKRDHFFPSIAEKKKTRSLSPHFFSPHTPPRARWTAPSQETAPRRPMMGTPRGQRKRRQREPEATATTLSLPLPPFLLLLTSKPPPPPRAPPSAPRA